MVKSLLKICLDFIKKPCSFETEFDKYWLNYGMAYIPFKFYQCISSNEFYYCSCRRRIFKVHFLKRNVYYSMNVRPKNCFHCWFVFMLEIKGKTVYLMRSYKKIESLSENLVAPSDIEAYNHYMKVFDQYVQNGKRNFHNCGEINFKSVNLKDELNKFLFYLDDLLTTLFFFLPKKFRKNVFAVDDYQENMNKTKWQFKIQIMKELGSVIVL